MKGVSKRRCKVFVCGGEGIVFVVQYSYTSIFSFLLLTAAAPIFSSLFFFFLSFFFAYFDNTFWVYMYAYGINTSL